MAIIKNKYGLEETYGKKLHLRLFNYAFQPYVKRNVELQGGI